MDGTSNNRGASGRAAEWHTKKPLVSIIVRTTGRPQLAEALASIAAQGYPDIEVVVVNAGGTPLVGVAARCGTFPIRVCGGDQPLGRGRAANVGLDETRGEWLVFLDEDDLFEAEHVAGLVATVQRTGCLAAYAGVRATGADTSDLPPFDRPFSAAALRAGNFMPIHAVLFSRRLLEAGCRFDETLEAYEDWDFWLQVAPHTAFERVGRITAAYRAGGRSEAGLGAGDEGRRRGRERVYEKWRQLWSGAEIEAMVEALNDEIRAREAEAGRLRAGLEALRLHATALEARTAPLLVRAAGRLQRLIARRR